MYVGVDAKILDCIHSILKTLRRIENANFGRFPRGIGSSQLAWGTLLALGTLVTLRPAKSVGIVPKACLYGFLDKLRKLCYIETGQRWGSSRSWRVACVAGTLISVVTAGTRTSVICHFLREVREFGFP